MGNANISTAHAYVADRVAPEHRARYMGIMGSAIGLGFIFGPAIGGLLSTPDAPQLPFVVAACLAAVNWVMAFLWLPESKPPGAPADHTPRPLFVFRPSTLRRIAGTQLGWLVLLNFMFYFAFAAMESTFALFTEARYGWGERETGYMFTGLGAVIVLMQGVVVGRAVSALGEKTTLMFGYVALAVGLGLAGGSSMVPMLVVGALLIATGNGLSTPSLTALLSRNSSDSDQGLNLGLNASAAALARILGPVGAGPLFEGVGPGVPMLMGASTVVLALLVAGLMIRQPEAGR
jgi:predicted MFS family arabinose efflux permease